MKRIIMAACIVSLAACGGDKDDVATDQQQDWESQRQSLVYSFPDNNQQQVPVPSPVVLRFSSPVMETSPTVVLREVGGPIVSDFEMEWVDGKRGLIITPDSKLKPLTEYAVQIPAMELEKGVAPAKNLRFSTRALYEGPKSLVASDTFEVTRTIPDGESYQVMDFSSFRVQFSQPLDQTTVKYGDSADATVQLMGPEGLVDVHLLVSGHYMTIDPKEDLTPGVEYSLNMTTGITSTYGETLPGGSFGNPGDTLALSVKALPQDTKAPGSGLRVSMVQDVADTGELSPLTGMPINLVPMASVLLGEDTATQASGTLAAELAFVPNFPDATPFRVKRGSLIEGASIEVLIGGEVPAGFESGKVRMDFLSDATGYLLPNPYSNADDAPRQVRLFMDVAVSTETPAANGAITQDLLHIELVGTSIVEEGRMVINAVGIVEPEVLGSERATGILSFYMKAYQDQDNPPSVVVDSSSPEILSWYPSADANNFNASDPIIVTLNKPVDLNEEARSLITLTENGQEISAEMYTRGSALVIVPEHDLRRSRQDSGNPGVVNGYVYTVTINSGLEDLLGNATSQQYSHSFELPIEVTSSEVYEWPATGAGTAPVKAFVGQEDVEQRSPMVLALYPGFPCALDEAERDFSEDIAGRCAGGLKQVYNRLTFALVLDEHGNPIPDEFDGKYQTTANLADPAKLPDDLLPIPKLPANRPIVAILSKQIDPNSVSKDGSFSVSKVDDQGVVTEDIDGTIKVDGKKITFYPKYPWEEGQLYRYVLGSTNDRTSSTSADCSGSQAICDTDSLPLQTQLHQVTAAQVTDSVTFGTFHALFQDANDPEGGGPSMIQYFRGAEEQRTVLQILNAPSKDINANMIHESNKPIDEDVPYKLLRSPYSEYFVEEPGASGQPSDPLSCSSSDPECLDPDGLLPPPNSAKLMVVENFDFLEPYDIGSVNIGCAFENTAQAPVDAFKKSVCPENKFTYLTSALLAEVGEYDQNAGGIPVKIWPGQILSTALPLYNTQISYGYGVIGTNSGPQVMRMRYAKEDDGCVEDASTGTMCVRNQPISAVIREVNGAPYISTNVDVYVDAIDIERRLDQIGVAMGLNNSEITSDLYSVPMTLNLEGNVIFNDDGTMKIAMSNTNSSDMPFNIKFRYLGFIGGGLADLTLRLPEGGSRMEYYSEIIE